MLHSPMLYRTEVTPHRKMTVDGRDKLVADDHPMLCRVHFLTGKELRAVGLSVSEKMVRVRFPREPGLKPGDMLYFVDRAGANWRVPVEFSVSSESGRSFMAEGRPVPVSIAG